jgi:hypothetical protein
MVGLTVCETQWTKILEPCPNYNPAAHSHFIYGKWKWHCLKTVGHQSWGWREGVVLSTTKARHYLLACCTCMLKFADKWMNLSYGKMLYQAKNSASTADARGQSQVTELFKLRKAALTQVYGTREYSLRSYNPVLTTTLMFDCYTGVSFCAAYSKLALAPFITIVQVHRCIKIHTSKALVSSSHIWILHVLSQLAAIIRHTCCKLLNCCHVAI